MSKSKFCKNCKIPIYRTSIWCVFCSKQNPDYTGKNHFNWKDDDVGYSALHKWVERKLGKPQECSQCSIKIVKKFEWANISGEYKRNINDWNRLCKKCHHQYDNVSEKIWIKRRQYAI